MTEELNRREYDRQFATFDKKLDQLSEQLDSVKTTLAAIAVQSVQIQTLQAMQGEMRGDLNELYSKLEHIQKFQSSCPRSSVGAVWKVVIGTVVAMTGAFMAHVLTIGSIK